jgi:hypothetical protein
MIRLVSKVRDRGHRGPQQINLITSLTIQGMSIARLEDPMRKRSWSVSLFVSVLLAVIVGFSTTAPRIQKAASRDSSTPVNRPAVLYGAFFELVVELQKQAAELELSGERGESLRGYVQDQANLNDKDARKLAEIAANCVEEMSRQDARALAVIQQFRSQFPGGKVPVGTKLPPPPPELRVLQEGRNQIILDGRNRLRGELGQTGFDKVARFAESNVSLKVDSTQPNNK